MNYQTNSSNGKWIFWLSIIVIILAFALGLNVQNAKWLNKDIAYATAEQMDLTTDIERQKAGLEVLILQNQTEIEIAKQKELAASESEKQRLEIDAMRIAENQKTEFRRGLYWVLTIGLFTFIAAAAVILVAWGIALCVRASKINYGHDQSLDLQPYLEPVYAPRGRKSQHQTSPAAKLARQRERMENERALAQQETASKMSYNTMLRSTRVLWSANQSEENGAGR